MRERKARPEIHTCVVGSGDDSMQTYCTFLVCFMSFFFSPSALPARRLYNIHTPSHQQCAVIRIFFPTRMRSRICFFLSFSFLSYMCEHFCCATLWSNSTSRKVCRFQSEETTEEKKKKGRWHACIITFRSQTTMSEEK